MKLIGFGSTVKGTAIHGIMGIREGVKKNSALCDKRIVGLIIDKGLTAEMVTCKKCLKKASILKGEKPKKKAPDKKALSQTTPVPAKKTPAPVKETAKKPPIKPKATPKTPVKPKTKPVKKAPVKKAPAKKASAAVPPKTKQKQIELPLKALNEFKLDQQSTNGLFFITHTPSEKVFFKNIEAGLATEILKIVNQLTVGWNGKESLPKEFRSSVLTAFKQAHVNLELALPTKFEEREEKEQNDEPPKITRRGVKKGNSKTETKITRRHAKKRSTVNIDQPITRRKRTPTKVVRHFLHYGGQLTSVLVELVTEFGFTETRAQAKFKSILRKITRIQRRTVVHTITNHPLNDHYIFLPSRKLPEDEAKE